MINTKNHGFWLGVDIGSVSLKLVVINQTGDIRFSAYRRSRGRPLECLRNVLAEECAGFSEFTGVVATGSGRELLACLPGAAISTKNEILVQACAAADLTPDVRTVIEIGGQDAKLILLEPHPRNGHLQVRDHSLNEVCAAGTGSFIDQQAERLGMKTEELSALAANMMNPANIAGRCAVFAKTDMMHLQQKGVHRSEIVEGLCLALVRNFIGTVGKGREFKPPINFQGGVAANPAVVKAFEHELKLPEGSIRIPSHFKVSGAYGAALFARDSNPLSTHSFSPGQMIEALEDKLDELSRLRPVRKAKEKHFVVSSRKKPIPEKRCRRKGEKKSGVLRSNTQDSTSSASIPSDTFFSESFCSPITSSPAKENLCHAFLGIDIGSVSTKLAVVDSSGKIIASWYRMNEGDPIASVQEGLQECCRNISKHITIKGAGVTGSGRHFIGALIGADVVVNEITAQAEAAMCLDPTIDTLFEIGGQDSKYIRFDQGVVTDFDMNKACAAGTGSFLQEQSARLGLDVEKDFARLAQQAERPCNLGTRCTVFMESDLIHHQQNGANREALAAGLARAVVANYLEKVVGRRRIGKNICLQGGVAGNSAVVEAFRQALGKPVTVSTLHRVTGAYGVALFALKHISKNKKQTSFRGFPTEDSRFDIRRFVCDGCDNSCSVSSLQVDAGEKVYSGGICGCYDTPAQKKQIVSTPDLFAQRRRIYESCLTETCGQKYSQYRRLEENDRVVGLPRSLFYFYTLPLWWTFLRHLGFKVVLSSPTGPDMYQRATRETRSETCTPVKLCYGHVEELISKGVKKIFIPAEIAQFSEENSSHRSYHCPYIQGIPYMMRAAFRGRAEIVTTAVYLSGDRENTLRAMEDVARKLGVSLKRVNRAAENAFQMQSRFAVTRAEAGQKALQQIDRSHTVVLLGKPHHVYDNGQNMQIVHKLRKMGVTALPYDYLPLREVTLPESWDNTVWKNARDQIRAAVLSVQYGLPTILLTSFGCGPDSFVSSYLEQILRGHPHLLIEMDEHMADAGLVTRLEAFWDTVRARDRSAKGMGRIPEVPVLKRLSKTVAPIKPSQKLRRTLENRTLYIPYICRGLNEILVAALKNSGISAESLPPQDQSVEDLGRKHAGGNECHPYILTLGDLVRLTERPDFDPDKAAFFMLNYDGACRLSQFAHSHKLALQRMGLEQMPVIAPITGTRSEELTMLFGMDVTQALWKGWLAAELLLRRLYATRPYELVPGMADAAYARGVEKLADAVTASSHVEYLFDRHLIKAFRQGWEDIGAVPVCHAGNRPRIGVIGEFFTELNTFANQDLMRRMESLGAEVVPQGFTVTNVLMYYYGHYYARQRWRRGRFLSALYYGGVKYWMLHWLELLAGAMKSEEEKIESASRMIPPQHIEHAVCDTIHGDIDPITSLFVARFKDFVQEGLDGICCPLVLNCMLGNLVQPIFRRIASENGDLPLMVASFDGLKQTNLQNRLEAFIEQARARHT